MVARMNLSLHHHTVFSTISIEGRLAGSNVDGAIDMFAMVPIDQNLIVDLSAVTAIDAAVASALHDELRSRACDASVVLVVSDIDVIVQLVMQNVDHFTQLVRTRADAVGLVTGVLADR